MRFVNSSPGSRRNAELWVALLLLGALLAAVLCSGWLFQGAATRIDLMARLTPPFAGGGHLLGTDPLGRDMLARVVAGAKISLLVGFVGALGALLLGTLMGLTAGYFRGFWDVALMRLVDVQLALPFILLAITVIAIFGSGLINTLILLMVSQCVHYARLVRGEVLSLRERDFVRAAQALGVGDWPILLRHILPNLLGPILVLLTLNIAGNILLESGLTFLGIGLDPSIPSWGGMLADGRIYLQAAWWVSLFPGLAILLTVLGINLLGDGLRDHLDPLGRTSR